MKKNKRNCWQCTSAGPDEALIYCNHPIRNSSQRQQDGICPSRVFYFSFPTRQLVRSRWCQFILITVLISQLPPWEDLSQSTDGSPHPPPRSPRPVVWLPAFSLGMLKVRFKSREGGWLLGWGRVTSHSPACIGSAAWGKRSSTSKYTTLNGAYRAAEHYCYI